MKKVFLCFALLFTTGYFSSVFSLAKVIVPKPVFLQKSKQLIVVITQNWSSTRATLQRYQRNSLAGTWKAVGKEVPAVIGKSGLAWSDQYKKYQAAPFYKKEGDVKSPAGAFTLGPAFGFQRLHSSYTHRHFILLKPSTICVDAVKSQYYGDIINSDHVSKSKWVHGEHMFQYKHYYQYGIVVNYNNSANKIVGGGSCIFLHVWKGPNIPTVGCTAMPKKAVIALIKWLKPKAHPILVQLPKKQFAELRRIWGLPKLA